MKLHHIGIATKDINVTRDYIKNLYPVLKETDIVYDANQDAKLCMLTLEDGLGLELIMGDKVNSFVDKKQYIYHLCFEVEDIEEAISGYRKSRDIIMTNPTPAVLFDNRRVAFVFSKIGIIELVEK
ncbi:MAG: VOC family protein [Lachnospiraceae bacterium]|nr:VOC family protein [Lachnospiraceae bacterium]